MTDDEYTPQVSGHETESGYAFTVEVRPPHQDDIADALARRMAADYTAGKALQTQVADRVAELVRNAVDDAAKSEIAAMLGKPIQRTDNLGNPVGEPVSFQQMLAEQVAVWQEEIIDVHTGKPRAKDGFGSSSIITRRDRLIRDAGAAEFEKLARAEVAKVRADAKKGIEAAIKSAVADAIGRLAK